MKVWKVWNYECFSETLSFAESLGWVNWLDNIEDDTEPQMIDEAEVDALDFIRENGYIVCMNDE